MDRAYANSPAQPAAPRAIESLIQQARQLAEISTMAASRLHDVRRRLTGDGDPQQAGAPNVKEAITCELVDLQQTLQRIQSNLHDIARYTEGLERV